MSGSYLVFVELPDPSMSGMFFLAVMLSFTMICAMNSANSWAAYDRQVALIRQQEALAATDSLTGIPNRRAFLDRVAAAVNDAAWGHPTVVCLVDLDGFKAVNDAGGHAAGDAALQSIAAALGRRGAGDRHRGAARWATSSPSWPTSPSASPARCWPSGSGTAVARVGGSTGVTASVGVRRGPAGGRRPGPAAPCGRRDVPVEDRRRQPRDRARLLSRARSA